MIAENKGQKLEVVKEDVERQLEKEVDEKDEGQLEKKVDEKDEGKTRE